jgi:hypothetical protein
MNKELTRGMEDFKKSIKSWKCDYKDVNLNKAYTKDRKELRKVYNLIKIGKITEAGEIATYLDTIVRDQIPSVIYNHITK